MLAHSNDEFFTEGSDEDVNVLNIPVDIHWLDDVRIFNRFKRRVDKGLVQIKDKSFLTLVPLVLRW